MAEIKKLLDDAIETEINNLNSASDKDEKSEVIKNLAALHKLRIEEIKTETEIEEKSERRAMDMIKRRNNYEEDHAFPALLYPGDCVRPLPGGRSSSPQLQGVTGMEGIANFISMLDYVLDTKRKRHITGGLLLSGALLFGGLAMTVMSIRDDEEDEDE